VDVQFRLGMGFSGVFSWMVAADLFDPMVNGERYQGVGFHAGG